MLLMEDTGVNLAESYRSRKKLAAKTSGGYTGQGPTWNRIIAWLDHIRCDFEMEASW